ncbi:MAG: YmfQ family protein [Treponema sp.]|jgi:uncharacterized protein YmfQ (DUF2313 family)|nr:YmfQ family protein [Treponema sp.]
MGIATASPDLYEAAFRKLFPRGDYWDRQFADPHSDVSLFCKVKLPEFIRFRSRMVVLLDESKPQSSEELLDEWERVLMGFISAMTDIQYRREELLLSYSRGITRDDMQKIAGIFGFAITDARLPYRPAFFGFSHFGIGRIDVPAAWQVIHISVNTQGGGDNIAQFETVMHKRLLANHIPYFFYDGGKS